MGVALQRQHPLSNLGLPREIYICICLWERTCIGTCTKTTRIKKKIKHPQYLLALQLRAAHSSVLRLKPADDKCAVILAADFYFWGYQLNSYYESRKLELHLATDACDSITARNSSFLKLFN